MFGSLFKRVYIYSVCIFNFFFFFTFLFLDPFYNKVEMRGAGVVFLFFMFSLLFTVSF